MVLVLDRIPQRKGYVKVMTVSTLIWKLMKAFIDYFRLDEYPGRRDLRLLPSAKTSRWNISPEQQKPRYSNFGSPTCQS
jgi:hypothetical protein